jgi:hypothetical protein
MKKLSSLLLALMLMVSGVTFAQTATKPAPKPKAATTESKPAVKKETKATTTAPMKKDGTPDKRYKENKKMKKDGTPDKRYKENKTATPVAN